MDGEILSESGSDSTGPADNDENRPKKAKKRRYGRESLCNKSPTVWSVSLLK